ncbi:MAG: DUF4127 family protein [Anaerolineae bacterium]
MRIALLPLDERPVNTHYPQMIADIAGKTVLLPPAHMLSDLRTPANRDQLVDWLEKEALALDVLIVSVEMLGYGGLIASRTTDDDTETIMHYLDTLSRLKQQHPALTIYAFNVITRISNADNNIEEPLYWDQYGVRLYRYSQWMHRAEAGEPGAEQELDRLRADIPAEYIADFTRRRLRNHTINLHMLELLADGALDLLVLSSDDTSEYGFGTQEKRWLMTWARRLGLDESRLLMYPGADEIGCVLVMRAAVETPTRFYVTYAIDEDQERIAPYEDSPVRVTVERQIRAIGGVQVGTLEEADLIVAVNPPSRIGQEYDAELENFASEQARRAPYIEAFAVQVGAWVEAGRRVVLCDVAYPNGSDPDLIAHLLEGVDLMRLAAYGAWNTAGNTIGTALAQGVAVLNAAPQGIDAQTRFLMHRFIEDWGYQHVVRQQVRDWLEETTGQRDTSPENQAQAIAEIQAQLSALLPQISEDWRITAVRLPWRRTFEVDFDLEPNT